MKQQLKIIDGDGHIFEDGEAIAPSFSLQRRRRASQERRVSS